MIPNAADLAPGDARSLDFELAGFDLHRIRSVKDPFFEAGFNALWAEFGAKNEMERRETLDARFKLSPQMIYEMIVIMKKDELVAVRDHTVIPSAGEAVVHLSHNLIMPDFRRTGLAGWMRAIPVETARQLCPGDFVTLVAEMEYDDGKDADRVIRLRSYQQAGFLKIDPMRVTYCQPDFRSPAEIDASGGAQPLPFQLLVRRISREDETTLTGAEVRRLVRALYHLYGSQFRSKDMAHLALSLDSYPPGDEVIRLIPPTA